MSALRAVQIEEMPGSVEAFVALCDRVAQQPVGGAAMMVVALLLYAEDEALGLPCLAAAVDRGQLQEGPGGYEGWELRRRDLQLIRSQVAGRAYVLRSYVRGSAPENGYRLVAPPYEIEGLANRYSGEIESGRYRVFLASAGAASPRPVTVQRDRRGIWKVSEWSSLLLGVRAPAIAGPGAPA